MNPYRQAPPQPRTPRGRFPWALALSLLTVMEGYYVFVTMTLIVSGQPWKLMLLVMGGLGLGWLCAVGITHFIIKRS